MEFFNNKPVLDYLADMLASFTGIESFTFPVRSRKGIWRKIRFNDMDLDSLVKLAQLSGQERRFRYYKRIADLCVLTAGSHLFTKSRKYFYKTEKR